MSKNPSLMKFFKCSHGWIIAERSNILQQDNMGYLLRLCIVKCCKCEKAEQHWVDTSENELNELKEGKSFLLKWR